MCNKYSPTCTIWFIQLTQKSLCAWQSRMFTVVVWFASPVCREKMEVSVFTFLPGKKVDKKVLLRERKRHTDRGVSSTTRGGVSPLGVPPSQVQWRGNQGGVPRQGPPWPGLMGGTQGGDPLAGVPPGQVWWRGYLRWGTPWQGYPLAGPGWGTPRLDMARVPPEVWTDRHLWKQYLTVVQRTWSVTIILWGHLYHTYRILSLRNHRNIRLLKTTMTIKWLLQETHLWWCCKLYILE